MPGKAAKVTITEKQQAILDEFSRSRSQPYFLRQRSASILRPFAGLRNEPIAPEVFRVSDVGAILRETDPSVSKKPTTHNNCRVSMAAFYGPMPTI